MTVRKIEKNNSSFGQKLKALRRDRGLSVPMVASAIHTQPRLIASLEEDDFSQLPESIYTRPLLRNLVRYLSGDEKYFLACFESARGTCDLIDPLLLPRQKVRRARFLVTPRLLKSAGLSLIAGLVVTYLSLQIRAIIIPPTIELQSPTDGISTEIAKIRVAGKVLEPAEVLVNNQPILLNQDGSFAALVDLKRGLNLITIEAKKRYSKKTTVYRRVVLEDQLAL